MEEKKLEFDQLSNDLFWKFRCSCEDKEKQKNWGLSFAPKTEHKIVGYNDKYWWDNVAPTLTEITCKCGMGMTRMKNKDKFNIVEGKCIYLED
jgi:hypothetical protein